MSAQNKLTSNKLLIAVLFVVTFLVYARTISYEFVWDDQRSHLDAHEDLMNGKVGAMWSESYDGMYIPVTYTSWYLLKEVAWDGEKLSPKPFHFANVLLHCTNTVLLFLILFLLFGNLMAAFAGSLLFALHPLQAESVAWVSEFRGLYSGFFSLMALWVLFRNFKTQVFSSAKDLVRTKFFIGATLLFVCAMLSKPSAVMLPFIAMLLTWCFFRDSFKAVRNATVIWICIALPIVLSTAGSQTNEVMSYVTPLIQRAPLAAYAFGFYLVKFFLPLNLAPSYGLTPQFILQQPMTYALAAIVLVVAVILFWKREKLKFIFTGYFLFLLSVLPVSGVITFYFQRYSHVADRYAYFGMVGMAIVAAYLCTLPKKKIAFGTLGAFIAICLFITVIQVPVWKNEFSIWDDSMKKYPDQYQAAYNRGVAYGKMGETEKAIADYTVALGFGANKNAFVNRANAYGTLGRYQDALNDYLHAIAVDPNDGSLYYNRALTNYNAGNYDSCPVDILKAQELGFPIDMQFASAVRDAMHRNDSIPKN